MDMVGIGGIAYDLVLNVDTLPGADGKYIARSSERLPGGFVSNAVCAAQALGLQTGYAGWIGDDTGGDLLQDDFVQRGVAVSSLERVPNVETPYTVILVAANGERAIVVPPNPLHNGTLSPAQMDIICGAGLVYTYPRSVAWCRELSGCVHENGGLFSLDMEDYIHLPPDDLHAIIAMTDVLFIAAGVRERLGVPSIAALNAPGWIIETAGANGAHGWEPGMDAPLHVPARRVPVVDTTGAGDCFHAALIAARLWGRSLADAMRFATAAASIAVGHAGARGGLPTRSQVEAVLDGA